MSAAYLSQDLVHAMPFGAEIVPNGGVRFRLWAPAANTVDVVFQNKNFPMRKLDDGWFEHAVETQVLGMPVKIVPCEELLWQKAFVMERERFDGADVMHILRSRADRLEPSLSRILGRCIVMRTAFAVICFQHARQSNMK